MKTFHQFLKSKQACAESIKWLEDRTIEQAVEDCQRGDWLLWLAYKLGVKDRILTKAKAACANTVRHLMKDKRSLDALDAAIKYSEGEISRRDLNIFVTAADHAAAHASAASEDYAVSAEYAAAVAAHASVAAYANFVVYDASSTANYHASDSWAARRTYEKVTTDICREILGKTMIKKFNQLIRTL